MKRRLVVLTEIIAPYRIPVFNALAECEGIDLHVIFLSETDHSMRQWKVYSEEIRFSNEVLPSWRRRVGKYNILVNPSVTSALRQAGPEVMVCGGYNYLASWQAQRWAKRNRVQFLLWCESTARDQRGGHALVESLKENFLRGCDGFVVPGKSSLEYMRQMGIPAANIFVAPNAVDTNLFSTRVKAARGKADRLRGELGLPLRYFLFVGRMVEAKGVLDLLHAYGKLRPDLRSEVGLVFAGDGPERAECEAVGRSIFPGTVHFAGFVHRDELAGYYGLAECFVFPTHSDTWGMVVNEAMACGLPVVCSEVAGCAADLVRSNGRIVAVRDAEQLAIAMQEIATHRELRERMARESKDLIQHYTPEACAAGIAKAAGAGFRGREDERADWMNSPPAPALAPEAKVAE
jgi:glycosyltransferase involved in cell wall biosynthesis